MILCPACNQTSTVADQATGRCAHCGAALPVEKPGTVADVRIDQTCEFDSIDPAVAAEAPLEPKSGTVHEVHGLQTAEFDAVFLDDAPKSPPVAAPSEAPSEPKSGTVHEVHGLQTAEFDAVFLDDAPSSPPSAAKTDAPPESKPGTVHDVHGLQTAEFGTLFGEEGADSSASSSGTPASLPPLPPKPPSVVGRRTVDNANIAQTYDSDEIGSSLVEQLSMAWGGEIEDGPSPHVTIKGKEVTRTRSDQTLVINSRAVRDSAKPLAPNTKTPATLADYELLSLLGEGGMGVVYTARQASIDRTVAVKMLKPGHSKNRDLQQKFLAEAVVTGDLDHPNIVPMYDLGKNESGDLFYAMKRVQGTPWNKAIAAKSQSENVEILLKAADAVAFAHSRGVIHRDLKPENIMLGEFGEVLVMDWGLAYSTAAFRKSASITQSSSMGGSPAYMAPEMATGPIDRVTFSSDIYLLGAILYEILTGRPPHSGGNVTKCLMAAARNDIVPTDKTGELVDVARRAMATHPIDRYRTVAAFQAAIRECLAHSESLSLAHRAEQELAKARDIGDYQNYSRALFGYEEAYALWNENERAQIGIRTARLAYASAAYEKGDFELAAGLLDRTLPEHVALGDQIRKGQEEREARKVRLRRAKRFVAGLAAAVFVIAGVAYFGIRAQRDRARDAEHQALVEAENARIAEGRAVVEAANARTAEGKAVVEAENARKAESRAVVEAENARKAESRAVVEAENARTAEGKANVARDEAVKSKAAEEYAAYGARIGLAAARIEENAFASAAELLETCPPELRDWEWGRLKYLCDRSKLTVKTNAPLNGVAVDPQKNRAAVGGWNGTLRTVALNDGKLSAPLPYTGMINAVAFGPQGGVLAVGGADPKAFVAIYGDADGDGAKSRVFAGHTKPVLSLSFNRAGDRLVTGSADGTARLWDVAAGAELRLLRGHASGVESVAFSPDEQTIVTAGADGTAIVWPLAENNAADAVTEVRAMLAHRGPVHAVAFAPDGRTVASAGADERVLLWQAADVRPYRLAEVFAENPPAPPTVREFVGHRGPVLSVAFSPDGTRLASCGVDNAVLVWDVVAGKLLKTMRGHAGQVRAVRFLADNRSLVSVGYDGLLKLWDVDEYNESVAVRPSVISGHADAVLSADFAPDEKSIVTASRDRTARITAVSASDAQPIGASEVLAEGHEYLTSSAAVTPDGLTLVTAAVDGTTRIWDLRSGVERAILSGTGRAAVLAVSADGRLALTGDSARGAQLWNLADGALVRTLPSHRTEVSAVAISPDGSILCTAEGSGRVNAYRTADGTSLWSELRHSRRITGLLFTSDGKQLLTASLDNTVGRFHAADGAELRPLIWKHPSGVTSLAAIGTKQAATTCEDGRVRLWTIASGDEPYTLTLPAAKYASTCCTPDGRYLAAVDPQTRQVRLYDVQEKKELSDPGKQAAADRIVAPWLDGATQDALIWSAVFTPDGASLVTVGGNEALLWDRATGTRRQTFRPHGAIAGVAYSPDGREVATAGWDGAVKIWDVAAGRAVRKLQGNHTGAVNSIAYSRDGRRLLTAGNDRTARLWDAATGKELASFAGHAQRVLHASFDSDGKRIVTASADGTARIWDVATGTSLYELVGHGRAVLSAEFSRDGKHVVTAGADDTARVWTTADGKLLETLTGHTAPVTSASFSVDGRRVVTGSRDSGVKLWDVTNAKELLSLKGHTSEVNVVRFSPSGSTILSAGADGTAILWPTAPWEAAK
ncbi:MAG: serine/threonine protein kinase [Pirellula sp.]|nr:serine/threonine protein kinase [Pirellula sp.]